MVGWQILVLKFWGASPYKVLWLTTLLLKSCLKFKLPRQSFSSQFSLLGTVSPWEQQTQHRIPCMQCCLLYADFNSFLKKRFNDILPWKRLFLWAAEPSQALFTGQCLPGFDVCWRRSSPWARHQLQLLLEGPSSRRAMSVKKHLGASERLHPTQRDNLNV